MLDLNNITLVALTSVRLEQTIKALQHSSLKINFGDIKLLSDIKPDNLPDNITHEYVPKCNNIDEWNYHIIYTLPKYIETDYIILIHDNGFIVNPEVWTDEFLKYDYIGAPWPLPKDDFSYRDINGEVIRQGNSVSLRSKKLLDVANKLDLEWKAFHGFTNEDGFICVNYRHEYINEGCVFAPIDISCLFSKETELPENRGINTFAFHNYNGENRKYPKF
jgi:hypothetical protein